MSDESKHCPICYSREVQPHKQYCGSCQELTHFEKQLLLVLLMIAERGL